MKIIIAVVGVLVLLVGGFVLLSEPSSETESNSQTSNSELTIETVSRDVQDGALFLDVRTPEEYAESYINGAENFPLQDLQQGILPETDKDEKIYVYCRSGNRSAEAKLLLESAGFSDVVDLGGLEDVASIGGVRVN